MCAIRSSCSATQTNAPTSPSARVPTVCVAPRSATGGGAAGPSTTWRATERPRTGSHTDWAAIAVAMAVDLSLEYMHILSCIISTTRNQAKFIIPRAARRHQPPKTLQTCEGRARSNGAVTHVTYNPDGSSIWVTTGHNVLILFPTDTPPGPSTTLYVGRVVFTVDTSSNFNLQQHDGQATDICATLS